MRCRGTMEVKPASARAPSQTLNKPSKTRVPLAAAAGAAASDTLGEFINPVLQACLHQPVHKRLRLNRHGLAQIRNREIKFSARLVDLSTRRTTRDALAIERYCPVESG